MLKINIGSGDYKIDGFQSCDFDPNTNPDFLFNLETDTFPFDDNTVSVVIANHVLEHLGSGYFHCLQELYRICENGAEIHITVPHHRSDDFFSDPTHQRAITVNGLKLFSKKYCKLAQEQKVRASRLANFYNVDFEVSSWEYVPKEKYRNMFDNMEKQQAENYLEQHCNIIDEIYVKLIVVK